MLFRFILLLVLLGGLVLFAQFNWTPIALTIFGVPTPFLPLSLWMLGAMGAGILTSLLIHALFSLTYHVGGRQARSRMRRASRQAEAAASAAASQTSTRFYGSPTDRPPDRASASRADDWDARSSDDWEDYDLDESSRAAPPRPAAPRPAPPPAAGRRESVVDADYRVIVPPLRSPEPTENADDWFEDNDLETEEQRRRRLGL